MENVQKPEEKLQISWFGGFQECIWVAFFCDFSMWDVLWWILGCTLVALRRYNAPSSGFGSPLGSEMAPQGDFLVRYPLQGSMRDEVAQGGGPGEG